MRHIYALPKEKVPRDDEFKFRDRAKVLVDRWHEVLSNKDKDATVRKPAANGKPHAEDAGASANGKDETVTTNGKDASPAAPEPAKADADAMDVDTKDAQGTEEDAPAEPELEPIYCRCGAANCKKALLFDVAGPPQVRAAKQKQLRKELQHIEARSEHGGEAE